MGNGLPKKVAILGGGISSLTAAFELTSAPNWQEAYDVTVYQMGWRLGGKGASSRNPQFNNRIEEHGLHIWLGFYENAFQIIRRCYGELARPASVPLSSWEDAFKSHSFVVLDEYIENTWLHWPCTFPPNESLPGDGVEFPTLWDYVVMALQWLDESFRDYAQAGSLQNEIADVPHAPIWLTHLVETSILDIDTAGLSLGGILIRRALKKAESLPRDPRDEFAGWR